MSARERLAPRVLRERLQMPPDDVAWLGLIAAVPIALAAFKWLAPEIGDVFLQPKDYDFYPGWASLVLPEPLEEARFLLSLALPMLLLAAVLILGSPGRGRRALDPLVIAIQAAVLVFVVYALTRQTNDGWLLLDVFDEMLLSRGTVIAGGAIGLGLTLALLLVRGDSPLVSRARGVARLLRERSWLPITLATVITGLWLLPSVTTDQSMIGIPGGHFPVQFEDYVAVVNDRTPYVDFIPSYAAVLPLAVGPILGAFDTSVTAFTVIACVLSGFALLAIYGTFAEITRRRWVALGLYVPFVAISLFPWTEAGVYRDTNASYYAQLPGRYLGPLVVAWLLARRLRGKAPTWAVFFAAGLTVLNNFEFGICALAALVMAVVLAQDRAAPVMSWARAEAARAAAGLLASVALISAVVLIRTGELPDLSLLFYWSGVYGGTGWALLPLPAFGLHWALYFTYVGALLVAAVRFTRADADRPLTGLLAYAAILGLATGQYFVGRSDPTMLISLFPVWGLALGLLTWTVALSLREARPDGERLRRLLIPAFAVMAGFGVMIAAVDRFPVPWDQVDRLEVNGGGIYDLKDDLAFVDAHTDPGEHVLIVTTPLDHRTAERAGVINVSPIGGDGLFSPHEANRAMDNLEDEGGTKLFEHYRRNGYYWVGPREVFAERGFRVVARDPVSGLVLWERDQAP